MKNKKSLLGLGLLALVLVLGVGYAVVSQVTLTFGGTATGVAETTLKVDIEGVNDSKTGVTHTLNGCGISDSFTIDDMTLDEVVTMTYTVKNHEKDVAATLTGVQLTNTNSEYFEANYSIENPNLAALGTTTVVVTVKMVKTPVVTEKNTAKIDFTINAVPVNNANTN